MTNPLIYDQIFEKIDYSENPLPKGEYEQCTFINCIFSGNDFTDMIFIECEFRDCNLSNVKILKTAFREVTFKNCKLLGLRWDKCHTFGLQFALDHCNVNHSIFYGLKLSKMIFRHCEMQETDFVECELTESIWDNCNLANAVFDRTNLEKADFSTAYNFQIDPENNRLKNARFSKENLEGLLKKYHLKID